MNVFVAIIVLLSVIVLIHLAKLYNERKATKEILYFMQKDGPPELVNYIKRRQLCYCAYVAKALEEKETSQKFSLALLERIAREFSEVCYLLEEDSPIQLRSLLSNFKSGQLVPVEDGIKMLRNTKEYCLEDTEKAFVDLLEVLTAKASKIKYASIAEERG
ncbi:MAG: hypothetical protein ACOYMB_03145 [Patescibacteria group bacterium]